ncbi:unnamed protein product [Rotaria magnacalcarata]|uniref:Uncharacterized protein n=1 Tax=Rotaria magnacalcarata TaxID=392030 RepID=A0A820KD26_9BILA|nr:unnamed protein product [Rotaria magnacalcarata]
MPLTAAERAKNYRDRLKQKTNKYNDSKRKDRERKARKRASMTIKEKEISLINHRVAQRRYREKQKNKNNLTEPKSLYSKQTLAKAAKKVLRVLPADPDKRQQILTRVGEDLDLFQQLISQRVQASASISRSSFAEFRPTYVLPKKTLAHRICICVTHENVNLLLKALSGHVQGLTNSLNTFLSKLVCDEKQESCMMSSCDDCINKFQLLIMNKITDDEKIIKWFQWINTNGRAVKQVFSGLVLQCVKQLKDKTPSHLRHIYIKRKQSQYFEDIKTNARDNTVVCQVDYAENFSMDNQDKIQSAHWGKNFVPIFTAYGWFGGSGGDGQSFDI